MKTDLQKNLPPSHLERGIEGIDPTLGITAMEKPLLQMLIGFVDRLQQGEQVNIHEYCCGVGVATEQLQLLLNALCIAAGVRARASVVGSDISPLHEEQLYPFLETYHHIAWAYLKSWNLHGINVPALKEEPQLQCPQARFVHASADQSIEQPGPLDFAFCIHGIWYVDDKLGSIFNTVESLRVGSGLAIWNALHLESINITHIERGKWQGNYKVRDFLRDHGEHDFRFHLEPAESRNSASTYTLSVRKRDVPNIHRPRFVQAVNANSPSPAHMPWHYADFRRTSEYEFEE